MLLQFVLLDHLPLQVVLNAVIVLSDFHLLALYRFLVLLCIIGKNLCPKDVMLFVSHAAHFSVRIKETW